jgi:argininosuccinate lyase
MARLWDKGGAFDDMVLRFTVGEDPVLDGRLVKHDVTASKAHARTLERAGFLSPDETSSLCDRLDELAASHARGEWSISVEEEDVHTALENRLGELGAKVHLGRSRNDQILVALRLYLLEQIAAARVLAHEVSEEIRLLAEREAGVGLPGYTHLQRAMPSAVSDWAMAYAEEIRHSLALLDAAESLARLCPLGSAAGYGTPGLALDRAFTAEQLGMKVQEPVTAPQLSRGKAESAFAFALVTLLSDVGRLASDLCLYNTAEFGFVSLPDEMTTGSSIMPQKRNPDVFELVRGHSGQATSDLAAILALTAKMPSGYHRDVQLMKSPLFRLVDRFTACFQVTGRAVGGLKFRRERCEAALTPELFAAEQAFELVKSEGLSFREAYRRVGASLAKTPLS